MSLEPEPKLVTYSMIYIVISNKVIGQ